MPGDVGASGRTLKCRKCRLELVRSPPHNIIQPSQMQFETPTPILCLGEEELPDWVNQAVEQSNWTKGRLNCPNASCGCRLGAFDFTDCRGASPVHLVCSKLDDSLCLSGLAVLASRGAVEPGNLPSSPETSSCGSEVSSGETDESNTESDQLEASREDSEEEEVPRPARFARTVRRRRRRRQVVKRTRPARIEAAAAVKTREEKLQELLAGEPELSDLPEDLLCPVCLDLLHEPFQVDPCGHIFCEPCLRRLGQKNPMNCSCPLCRTKIGFCKHLAATSREIREDYEMLYLKRKKFERGTPVFQYPLPWQPGWRNLLRGRPLGGNRFLRDNRTDLVRAVLHQIPYYVPPVMIANLINIGIFAFMMGFIEIFPNLLAIIFGSSRNVSLPLNASDVVSETSGEALPLDGDSEGSLPVDDITAVVDEAGLAAAPVMDSTFYFILFGLSLLAAGLGQILLNQELHGNVRFQRLPDLVLVLALTVMPLLIIPTLLPYRGQDGSWLGNVIEKAIHFLLNHLNYHTGILLCFTVWFIYHVDVNEDIWW